MINIEMGKYSKKLNKKPFGIAATVGAAYSAATAIHGAYTSNVGKAIRSKVSNAFKKKKDPRTSEGPLRAVKNDLYGKKDPVITKHPYGMPSIPSNSKVKKQYKKEEKLAYKNIIRSAKDERKRKDDLNEAFFGRFAKKEKKTLPDKAKATVKAVMGKISMHKYKKGTMMAD